MEVGCELRLWEGPEQQGATCGSAPDPLEQYPFSLRKPELWRGEQSC